MSATTIYRKRGDTGPALRAQLLDGNDIEDAVPVDLTGASSAKLVMRKPDTSVLEGSMVIEAGTSGWVSYTWGASDLALVGQHAIEVEVTWANGTVQTFPAAGHDLLVVGHDLG